MSIDTTTDTPPVCDEPRNPISGMLGFLAVFAGFGATYVAVTRHDNLVAAQLGVTAAVCTVIATMIALPQRHPH